MLLFDGDIYLNEHEDSAWVSKNEFKNYNFAEGDKDIISFYKYIITSKPYFFNFFKHFIFFHFNDKDLIFYES